MKVILQQRTSAACKTMPDDTCGEEVRPGEGGRAGSPGLGPPHSTALHHRRAALLAGRVCKSKERQASLSQL